MDIRIRCDEACKSETQKIAELKRLLDKKEEEINDLKCKLSTERIRKEGVACREENISYLLRDVVLSGCFDDLRSLYHISKEDVAHFMAYVRISGKMKEGVYCP